MGRNEILRITAGWQKIAAVQYLRGGVGGWAKIKSPAGLALGGALSDAGSAVRWCGWGWCFDTVALF
jgi:hypothetical protein